MDVSALLDAAWTLLTTPIVRVGEFELLPVNLVGFGVVLALAWLGARSARRLSDRVFTAESEEEEAGTAFAAPIAYWTVLVLGLVLSLHVLGIDMATARDLMGAPLFEISGEQQVTAYGLFFFAVVVYVTWFVSRLVRQAADRSFRRSGVDEGTIATFKRLIHYGVMAVGLALALDNLGVNLGALFAAGAVFAVGIGFAMQTVAQNFVSGLILLAERSIKPGDVLEVDGMVVVVEKMGIRATVARTRDEEEIIIPNSTLVQTSVKNYTLRDSLYRLRAQVGVEYGSDMALVADVLKRTAESIPWRFPGKEPVVLLTAFGDSSVNFDVSVWMNDPWTAPKRKSELNRTIWDALKQAQVAIAFPQLDVHFDPPIEEAATRSLPRAS